MGAGPWGERLRHVSGRTGLSWQMRLRWALLLPWKSRWNARIRDWTARLESNQESRPDDA